MDYEKILLKALSRIDQLEDEILKLNRRIDIFEDSRKSSANVYLNYDLKKDNVISKQCIEPCINNKETEAAFDSNDDIRNLIRYMSEKGIINEYILDNFKSEQWCKENFHLSYPLLREKELGRYDKKNEYTRYWNEVIQINGKCYYICQEWFPKRRKLFRNWYIENIKNRESENL